MSQDVTTVEGAEQGPEWRTLKGMEAPLRMWGSWSEDHFRSAGDRKQVTGEAVVLVRLWSEQRGTARYAETQDGRTVYLGGAATRFWVQAGAGVTPVEVVEEAPVDEQDAEEAPAVEEEVRHYATFENVKAAPGHQEMRLSIRVQGQEDAVEFYALPYVPGWTAEGVCKAFGWHPVASALEYVGTRTERGEVRRTAPSATPGALAARQAVREEIVARFAVRLVTGLAAHFQAVFRVGRAYPIGWTYRVSYGAGDWFGWVTAGGIMPPRFSAQTRDDAEAELRALDPTALPGHPDLQEYVSGLSAPELGPLFLALRDGDLTSLPATLTAGVPITAKQARDLVERSCYYMGATEFETLQGEGGRFLGWTFRVNRGYGWVTGAGTVSKALEPYRSTAADVLGYADREDRETAERTAVAGSMAGRKLAPNRCVHDRYAREDVEGDPVLACTMQGPGEAFAVFTVEGVADTAHCAVVAANVAARFRAEEVTGDADAEPPFWAKTCPEHVEEVAGRCALCGQDTPDEDAVTVLTARQAEEAARRVHPDAHTFTPFHRAEDGPKPAGWTFRTGHGAQARYGVLTRTGRVADTGLYEYRTTAERAYLQAHQEPADAS